MIAKPVCDLVGHRLAAVILGGVVPERADRPVLAAAILDTGQ